MAKLQIGDRVRYSSSFCRTIGAVTGFTPQVRGEITSFWGSNSDFATITWDFVDPNGSKQGGAHISALQRCR